MTSFILHFDSRSVADKNAGTKTAVACVMAEDLDAAETAAREAIAENGYQAGGLIAYSTFEHAQAAGLDGDETMLYLRAQQSKSRIAVTFY